MKTSGKSKKQKQVKKTVKNQQKKVNKKESKRRVKIVGIFGVVLIFLVLTLIILFSDLFKITAITVCNNSKVLTEEIIQNSGFIVGNNMFQNFKLTSENKIKTNPYIEDVKITRKISGEVVIEITERVPTFMLQYENAYAYINNQGYILEISQVSEELPIIKGYSTEEIKVGNRMNLEDLKKLDTVIQIMDTVNSNGIQGKITIIDITNQNNIILEIPSEAKTVQFGDNKNINIKVLWIMDIINREKGIEGEIILNVSDIKKVYFREKV